MARYLHGALGVTGAGQKGLGPSSPQGSDLTPCTWSADPLSLPVKHPCSARSALRRQSHALPSTFHVYSLCLPSPLLSHLLLRPLQSWSDTNVL